MILSLQNQYTLADVPELEIPKCTNGNLYPGSEDDEDEQDQQSLDRTSSTKVYIGNNCCTESTLKLQSTAHLFYSTHSRHFKRCFYTVLVGLYFAYFGYAMYYKFGDEPSIRLLWMTCLVVGVQLFVKLNVWTRLGYCLKPIGGHIPESATPYISR